jgi:putative ABC transport system permease protein
MNSIARDLRSSLRILRNNPAFTFVVVCTLALGIGINTAMFTLLDALLLRALPYPNSARLVSLETKTPTGQIVNAASYPDFLDWKHARSFSMMAASSEQELIAAGAGRPERVFGELVSPDYFDLLGLHAIRGRVLTSAEAGGPSPVAVISENFWTRRFAHRGDIVGASVQINDQPITVVGVLPRGARGLSRHTDLWLPIGNIALVSTPQLLVNRAAFLVTVVGRLNPGADLRSAGADLQIVARNLQSSYPDTNRGRGVVAKSLAETRVASYREAVMILFAAGVFVMLIAAANVANLVLARSVSRQQEIAVRLALGASRSRLVRQILSENVVLAVLGASAGLLLASAALRFMRAFQTYGLDDASAVALNVPALLFTSAAALVVGILIGLFPAVHLSFASFQQNLKEGSRGITGGSVWSSRFRNLLVIFQSALATLLLVACGLMFRTLLHLSEINPGFRTQNVIAMQLAALPPSKYPEPVQLTNYYWSLLRSVDSVPGVQAAGATMRLPLTGPTPTVPFTIQGRGGDSAGQPPLAFYSAVSPDYFDVLAVPLSGRAFTERDNAAAAPVVIVNRALARRFWPGRNPIGEHLRFFDGEPRWREVVGIINDLRTESLTETREPPRPTSW